MKRLTFPFALSTLCCTSLTSCSLLLDSVFSSGREEAALERRAKQYEKDGKSKREASRHAFYDSVGFPTGY
ncbi:hypothetical protein [Roseibacillus ishigakijimensis]|uniref:Uncharacterized protein n=1 Tax=Roseibacillus ishigakijimensis TaxID=454146 RepID=A0A934RSQ4_9BACT|nr:hypothetical protein [Roseibacillus ishigakijimensis]MBK1834956.1 hypothetical protein [Roseibacillus ishigakijimensis]